MANQYIRNIPHLSMYESENLFHPNSPLSAGTYLRTCQLQGNSILSTLYVKSMPAGATVKVNYYDTTTGNQFGERYDLDSHDLLSGATANFDDRIIVTKIHNAVNCEVIVTGGPVEIGVYVTLIADFASDLDSALVKDGQTHLPNTDLGIPIVCLDEATNTLNFLRCVDGSLSFVPDEGDPFFVEATVNTTIGGTVTVFSFAVPTGTTRNVKTLKVLTEVPGRYSLLSGGSEIAAGILYEAEKNIEFKFDPSRPISAGTTVELKYKSDSSFGYSCPITGFLMASDFT